MRQILFCAALGSAALLAGCGGGTAGQAPQSPSQTTAASAAAGSAATACYPAALPGMIGFCMAPGEQADAAPARVPCRTPDAPAGFKATPPVSPESECAAAAP